MAIDIFADNASATVSAGGTTAPAAGTSESWTLSSIVGLAASSSAVLPTQMRLVDPADARTQPEIMLLTNLSGASATVKRGVEGTTPVAHTAGFTVRAVVTRGSLWQPAFMSSMGFRNPSDYGYAGWSFDPHQSTAHGVLQNQCTGVAVVFGPETAAVSTLYTYVAVAGASLTSAGLAIYDQNFNLLQQTASLSTAFQSSGLVSASITPVSITPGTIYWVAIQAAGTTQPQFNNISPDAPGMGNAPPSWAVSPAWKMNVSQSSFPSTGGAVKIPSQYWVAAS